MLGGAVAAWVVAAAAVGPVLLPEVLFGMLAPLLMAIVSWTLVERTYRRSPAQLTGLMVTAFAGKMVFFGAYVTVMLWGLALRPVPFVVSFTASFIGLHLAEALCLWRLFQGDAREPNHLNHLNR
jgi:hypothetical protein